MRGGDGDAENGEQGQDDTAAEEMSAWPMQRGGAWTAGRQHLRAQESQGSV